MQLFCNFYLFSYWLFAAVMYIVQRFPEPMSRVFIFNLLCAAHMETGYSQGVCVYMCACKCGTDRLKSLEQAVEEKIPDDFAILKGRNIPDEEIRNNCQRGWTHDPAGGQERRRVERWQETTKTTTLAWNSL